MSDTPIYEPAFPVVSEIMGHSGGMKRRGIAHRQKQQLQLACDPGRQHQHAGSRPGSYIRNEYGERVTVEQMLRTITERSWRNGVTR